MKISVKVKPRSKNDSVERVSPGELIVRVKAPAIEGRANDAVIKMVSVYLNIPKSRIEIVRGIKGRSKLLEIY